jgi:hypothetical protein
MDRVVHNVTEEGRMSGRFGLLRAAFLVRVAPDGARVPWRGLSSEWNC